LTGAAGLALLLFGAFRLVTQVPPRGLIGLAGWLGAALLLHDGVLAPLTAVTGLVLRRTVRPRARRYVQGGVVAAIGVSVIAVPLILRRGTQPAPKALLRQDYAVHLAWLWVGIGVVSGLLYVARVLRDRRNSVGLQRDGEKNSVAVRSSSRADG
jgi:hypothetical protein